jgi:hypothetical protein
MLENIDAIELELLESIDIKSKDKLKTVRITVSLLVLSVC